RHHRRPDQRRPARARARPRLHGQHRPRGVPQGRGRIHPQPPRARTRDAPRAASRGPDEPVVDGRTMTRYTTRKLGLLAVAALAFEFTRSETCSVGGARAEALLSLACFAALFARDSGQGLLASWMIGIVKDVGSAGPLGLHALLFLAAGGVVL